LSTYLLEIGTEELPAKFAVSIINQFKSIIEFEFKKNRISFDDIFCTTTPRRIVLKVSGLEDMGKDAKELRKGPKAEVAFINNKPSNAAIGFAKSLNISTTDLKIRNTKKGEFVFGERIEKGKSSRYLISQILPKAIKSLQGQRFMKWGKGNFKFSRPIRWVVSLYNNDLLNFSLENLDPEIVISKFSRGHRLVHNNIEINNPEQYFQLLEESNVIVNRDIRKSIINDLIKKVSDNLKLVPDLPGHLLEEITDLVEIPTVIEGSFDSQYLSLPVEVLCTVMKSHQRYIPLFKSAGNFDKLETNSESILSTNFLLISNGLKDSNNLIKMGNEKVIKARFADAKFFMENDKKISCEERNHKISSISYMKGLGNLLDKVKRMEFISKEVFYELNDNSIELDQLLQASKYSKHDLCSEIVFEFPELQGLMGGKYLNYEGFSKNVSLAVAEHYLPRFYRDDLPSSKYGAITSIADKLEMIVSIFVLGKRPTGSSDPYALRRNLNGIINILWSFDFNLRFDKLIKVTLIHWEESLTEINCDYKKVLLELLGFFQQRLISHLEELSYSKEIINSIFGINYLEANKIYDILDVKKRINTVQEIKNSSNSISLINLISRFSKLANNGKLETDKFSLKILKVQLFEKESEHKVFNFLKEAKKLINNPEWNYYDLVNLFDLNINNLNELFDNEKGVLIMSDNLELRENRLNLLGLVRNYSLILADFTLLSS